MNKDSPLTEATFYILLALRHPNHGYGIIQEISTLTNDRVTLGAGTLYGAINSLIKKKWIKLYSEDKSSRKKKKYVITKIGYQVFKQEEKRLSELINSAELMEEYNGQV